VSLDQPRKIHFICRPNDFHSIAILHQLFIDNNKKLDGAFIDLGQQENVSNAELLAELESIAVMICKPT